MHLSKQQLNSVFKLVTLELPDDTISYDTLRTSQLPEGWDSPSDYLSYTRRYGDEFCHAGTNLGLKVPSAVVEDQYNFLLNPLHPDMKSVKISSIRSYHFDQRLQTMVTALAPD
ncbi:MAG: RES family NAD+ phosphorylase [Cyclobacteriaceae bacterium]